MTTTKSFIVAAVLSTFAAVSFAQVNGTSAPVGPATVAKAQPHAKRDAAVKTVKASKIVSKASSVKPVVYVTHGQQKHAKRMKHASAKHALMKLAVK